MSFCLKQFWEHCPSRSFLLQVKRTWVLSLCLATPLSPLAMGAAQSTVHLELTGQPLQLQTGQGQGLLPKLRPWWSHQAKAKDAGKLHLLKITDISSLCHQREVRCEKFSWDPCRSSKPLCELSQVALFKEGAWKVKLEEGSVNLGRGCQCMDGLWVNRQHLPERIGCYTAVEIREGRGLLWRAGRENPSACKMQQGRKQGSTWSLFTTFLHSSALCSTGLWAVMVLISFQRWHFFCMTLFTLGVGEGDPLIIQMDQRSRKSSFKLLLWLEKHATLLPLDIIKSTCSVLVYALKAK